jgi:hypothetical protein
MKCPKCNLENVQDKKNCKKCGALLDAAVTWKPTLRWHLKSLSIIFVILIVSFVVLNIVLKPYMRKIPSDITPWLNKTAAK